MNKNNEKVNKKVYYSILDFEQDFFPEGFRLKYEKKPQNIQLLGADLAKESFKKAMQTVMQ